MQNGVALHLRRHRFTYAGKKGRLTSTLVSIDAEQCHSTITSASFCIYVGVDVVVEWQKSRRYRYRVASLCICISVDAVIEWRFSASALANLSLLGNCIDVDVDAER